MFIDKWIVYMIQPHGICKYCIVLYWMLVLWPVLDHSLLLNCSEPEGCLNCNIHMSIHTGSTRFHADRHGSRWRLVPSVFVWYTSRNTLYWCVNSNNKGFYIVKIAVSCLGSFHSCACSIILVSHFSSPSFKFDLNVHLIIHYLPYHPLIKNITANLTQTPPPPTQYRS